MNLLNIFNEIEENDPEFYGRTSDRRHILKNFGSKVAVAALPFALGSLFKRAYGKTTDSILDVLNFALTLEYLESSFYDMANSTSGLIPASTQATFTKIGADENAHVAFLKNAITAAGGTPVSKPTFDFSGGNGSGQGPFANAFSDYDLFLAVSQTLEDTGVRAYKGQATNLMSDNATLTAALNIHSVEARHASHIRMLRMQAGANIKPWITLNQSGIQSTAVQSSYDGEENIMQAGNTITGINGKAISSSAASEAFDEPLTKAQVMDIIDPFIV